MDNFKLNEYDILTLKSLIKDERKRRNEAEKLELEIKALKKQLKYSWVQNCVAWIAIAISILTLYIQIR